MPAPRQLPDKEELLNLRRQGMTYEQIGERYGVSKGAVYLQLRDAGAVRARPDHSKYLPWKIKTAHQQAKPAGMLRFYSRREQGDTLPEVKERMLDKWLTEIKEADVVVCYHREMAPNPASPDFGGFYYSKRRPSDGDRLIRFMGESDAESPSPVAGTSPVG